MNRIWHHLKNLGHTTPKYVVHVILIDSGDAVEHKRKQKRRKWIRYERKHSNTMQHTDYKRLDDTRWLIIYEDGASRYVAG